MALLDHQGRIDEIRFLLGDVNTSILPDSTIGRFVTMEEEDYDTGLENQCYVIYNALMKCLLWLVNKSVASTGGVSGGAITKVKEEMGSIKKEIQYSASVNPHLRALGGIYMICIRRILNWSVRH